MTARLSPGFPSGTAHDDDQQIDHDRSTPPATPPKQSPQRSRNCRLPLDSDSDDA
jgi:hypothetical protein